MKRQLILNSKEPRGTSRCFWSKSEDKVLKTAVKLHGIEDWAAVAGYIRKYSRTKTSSKTQKQCKERWSNRLNPEVHLSPLSKDEINKLFSLHMEVGNRWANIASELPGRTDNVIKNWFLCKLRKIVRSIKKENATIEVPKNSEELAQELYMLDYLYKYYLSSDRCENIKKALNSQIKKRKNAGDKYINSMIENKEITMEKLSIFVRLLFNEIRFNIDKSLIQKYDYLKDIGLNRAQSESEINNIVPNHDPKNETIISTYCIISIILSYNWQQI